MEAMLIVLPSSERLPRLLDALEAAGAPGATVYDSQGQEFLRWLGQHAVAGQPHRSSKTVLAVVPDEAVEAVLAAAAAVMDDFAAPFSGMLCSWPVSRFYNFRGHRARVEAGTSAHS